MDVPWVTKCCSLGRTLRMKSAWISSREAAFINPSKPFTITSTVVKLSSVASSASQNIGSNWKYREKFSGKTYSITMWKETTNFRSEVQGRLHVKETEISKTIVSKSPNLFLSMWSTFLLYLRHIRFWLVYPCRFQPHPDMIKRSHQFTLGF